ncbi:Arm DNA-binding domain-containing protein [Flavobacterium agrisoli]|uniref:Arm DNA-binding domain-containing protein n=1 Tax=Flavobacterium agrisoli TaxID=2793066 RepID=A0A934PKY8_9FLAO|nr:hypothetical protein [Flavobacterium agrisoli]
MNTKVNILFYAKNQKSNKNGLVPIYTRITVDGKRIELSTSKFVEYNKWNPKTSKMSGNSLEVRTLNEFTNSIRY